MNKLIPAFAVTIAAAYALGHQSSQEPDADPNTKLAADLIARMKLAELNAKLRALGGTPKNETVEATKGIPDLISAVSANSSAAVQFSDFTLSEFYSGMGSAKSAVQVSQSADEASVKLQAIQVVQNAKIIETLRKIAAKK